MFIADNDDNRMIAGTGNSSYGGDGDSATPATLNPAAVALDSSANVYVTEYFNHRIRKVTVSTGKISMIAGTGISGTRPSARTHGPSSSSIIQTSKLVGSARR